MNSDFQAVKVFTVTKQKDREELGEVITQWLLEHGPSIEIVDKVVKQSSDNEYHCLSVILFYRYKKSP